MTINGNVVAFFGCRHLLVVQVGDVLHLLIVMPYVHFSIRVHDEHLFACLVVGYLCNVGTVHARKIVVQGQFLASWVD